MLVDFTVGHDLKKIIQQMFDINKTELTFQSQAIKRHFGEAGVKRRKQGEQLRMNRWMDGQTDGSVEKGIHIDVE